MCYLAGGSYAAGPQARGCDLSLYRSGVVLLECAGTWWAFHHIGHFMSPGWGFVLLDFFGYYTSVELSLSRLLSEYVVASECRVGRRWIRICDGTSGL
jgi:hypothetical protein